MSSDHHVTRRAFVQTALGAGAASLLPFATPPALEAQASKRRLALIGTGSRGSTMWGRNLVNGYADLIDFVGLCDINPRRVEVAKRRMGLTCPTFTDFDEMITKTRPDHLMVTTVDAFHGDYIVRGLDRGLSVMTEKPMVIDEHQCQAVLDAERRNNRKIIVTFNYRYAPAHQVVKETLMSGEIGPIMSVDFSWYLDVIHGADYFRRWHRLRNKSGTLLVHKASHHFDLANWWLDAEPVDVTARGALKVYGKNGAFRSTNCRPCQHKSDCRFAFDITKDEEMMDLYVGCESADGYLRDGCVFREDIDIYDSMTALVRYTNGATMTYSVNAFMPFEGYRIAFNGEKGRLEVRSYERQPWPVEGPSEMYLTKSFGERRKIEVPPALGDHGGGDARMQEILFRGKGVPAHLTPPDSRAGAMACLTGIAARKSIEEGRPIAIADLVKFS
jgi:predicted dehydrogenase